MTIHFDSFFQEKKKKKKRNKKLIPEMIFLLL